MALTKCFVVFLNLILLIEAQSLRKCSRDQYGSTLGYARDLGDGKLEAGYTIFRVDIPDICNGYTTGATITACDYDVAPEVLIVSRYVAFLKRKGSLWSDGYISASVYCDDRLYTGSSADAKKQPLSVHPVKDSSQNQKQNSRAARSIEDVSGKTSVHAMKTQQSESEVRKATDNQAIQAAVGQAQHQASQNAQNSKQSSDAKQQNSEGRTRNTLQSSDSNQSANAVRGAQNDHNRQSNKQNQNAEKSSNRQGQTDKNRSRRDVDENRRKLSEIDEVYLDGERRNSPRFRKYRVGKASQDPEVGNRNRYFSRDPHEEEILRAVEMQRREYEAEELKLYAQYSDNARHEPVITQARQQAALEAFQQSNNRRARRNTQSLGNNELDYANTRQQKYSDQHEQAASSEARLQTSVESTQQDNGLRQNSNRRTLETTQQETEKSNQESRFGQSIYQQNAVFGSKIHQVVLDESRLKAIQEANRIAKDANANQLAQVLRESLQRQQTRNNAIEQASRRAQEIFKDVRGADAQQALKAFQEALTQAASRGGGIMSETFYSQQANDANRRNGQQLNSQSQKTRDDNLRGQSQAQQQVQQQSQKLVEQRAPQQAQYRTQQQAQQRPVQEQVQQQEQQRRKQQGQQLHQSQNQQRRYQSQFQDQQRTQQQAQQQVQQRAQHITQEQAQQRDNRQRQQQSQTQAQQRTQKHAQQQMGQSQDLQRVQENFQQRLQEQAQRLLQEQVEQLDQQRRQQQGQQRDQQLSLTRDQFQDQQRAPTQHAQQKTLEQAQQLADQRGQPNEQRGSNPTRQFGQINDSRQPIKNQLQAEYDSRFGI